MMLSADAAQQLGSCKVAIKAIEDLLSRYLVLDDKKDTAQVVPLEQATQHLLLAQSVSSLYQCYIRLSGKDVEDSPHATDMERLRLYKKKIHKVESQKWFKEHKRSLEINVSAANRFISNAIPELTAEQRSALKKARNPGKRVKEPQHTEAPSKSPTEDAADFLDSMQVPEQPQRQATGQTRNDAELSQEGRISRLAVNVAGQNKEHGKSKGRKKRKRTQAK